jgi:NADP-reducing hydrogenase subunit HndB
MSKIKSLEDLKRVREGALKKRQIKAKSGKIEIVIGLGTPGFAVGASETKKAILKFIDEHSLSNIFIRQAGNIGMDSWEPVIQVTIGENQKITYGKVIPGVARQIMQEHIVGGKPVKAYIIEA